MPAYNFPSRFIDKILSREKSQTIRKRRTTPTREGDTLYLYTGMRTKKCILIAKAICDNIIPIHIRPFQKRFAANILTPINEFVIADGFNTTDEFFEFFQRYKQEALDDFEIIYWTLL